MIVCNYWQWHWHWGHNYWPYYKKSIIIDKSQYIDIEENQDIDIVIDIEDGQWQPVNIDIGCWHWLLKIIDIDIGPKISSLLMSAANIAEGYAK